MTSRYPFTALVGQETMKLALVLNAINPRLGGVLIRGQKGTAKSTAARGLAALLPPVEVVEGCRFGCEPEDGAARCPECETREDSVRSFERPAEFVELPIGATEDRVLGTLDIERALVDGRRHFEPGLLARANRGLLYVDEVNLLPDHLVDTLLDAAAMGVNSVEREGISFSHPAAFVLVGTMNPEEGELRPQLLDRFALAVDVEGMPGTAERVEVVRRRVAFEADPAGFAARWHAHECAEQTRIRAARALLSRVRVDDGLLELIARICTAFDVDGLRGDIVIYKTASTLAAYMGREQVTADDVRRAAELALLHRRRRMPFDQPGLDRERLDDIVGEQRGHSDDEPPEFPTDRGEDEPPRPKSPGGMEASSHSDEPADQVFEMAAPPTLPSFPLSGAPPHGGPAPRSARGNARRAVGSPRGRHVRTSSLRTSALDVMATLCAAAPLQRQRRQSTCADDGKRRIQLKPTDLRFKIRSTPLGALTVFVVDASGSMAAQRRMALAKGAVMSLLLRAYQTRDEVALIAFRGTTAEVLLPPATSVQLASVRLRVLPTGGRTPLALALRRAGTLVQQRAAVAQRTATPTLVIVSDGRANVALAGGDPNADALAEARLLRAAGVGAIVVDTEDGPIRLGRAWLLATELGGAYVRLADLSAGVHPDTALATHVRDQQRRSAP
jgi:magnesium chelatase subunit D